MKNFNKYTLTALMLLTTIVVAAQNSYKMATVAFYNVENLWDTIQSVDIIDGTKNYLDPGYHYSVAIDSPEALATEKCKTELTYEKLAGIKCKREQVLSDEFTPNGGSGWTYQRYHIKLDNMTKVIAQIGKDKTGTAPAIVGFAELENEIVLKDMIEHPNLKPYNYGMVHYNSFDARGIDVGLIYQKKRFIVESSQPYPIVIKDDETGNRDYTRDILRVDGYLDGEKIHILVNHWPSRRGGEVASEPRRLKAAEVCLDAMKEIRATEPDAKIIVMGDFNDGPLNTSIRSLGTVAKKKDAADDKMFNAMEETSSKGGGTAAFQDGWETLDQLIMSSSLLDSDLSSYKLYQTNVFMPSYLIQPSGEYKGYPFRTFSFGKFAGGYSDHFPVYLYLIKK